MARYEHLPICRKVFDLAVYIEQVTQRRIAERIVRKFAGFANREDSR